MGILLFLLAGLTPLPGVPLDAACKTRCYQQKSFDYQKCRMIPPAKRDERSACFVRADAALDRCLRGC